MKTYRPRDTLVINLDAVEFFEIAQEENRWLIRFFFHSGESVSHTYPSREKAMEASYAIARIVNKVAE